MTSPVDGSKLKERLRARIAVAALAIACIWSGWQVWGAQSSFAWTIAYWVLFMVTVCVLAWLAADAVIRSRNARRS